MGIGEVESFDTELEGLVAMVPTLADGDVLAFMCHDSQPAVQGWLADRGVGAVTLGPGTVRLMTHLGVGDRALERAVSAIGAAP